MRVLPRKTKVVNGREARTISHPKELLVMKLRLSTGVALLFVLLAPLAVRAELSKQEREAAQKMISGTLYLRVQVPYKFGRGAWAPYSESLLEVSPAGLSTERKMAVPLKKHEEIYWGYLANTPVNNGKLVSEGGKLVVWMERVEPNTEVAVDFIDIKAMDDFTKAFNMTFSKVPLQNEHPEWPSAVREGIAAGKLVVGMTVEQAKIVVGAPLSVSAGEENGSKTETWLLRQDPGKVLGWNRKHGAWKKVSRETGFPAKITFADGKLQVIEQTPRAPDLSGK
jgi:hypothetical protein